tara:strand:+ start:18038 stop:19306 length:1269 start_codon:yes stop_codon:yes gene_type:complete
MKEDSLEFWLDYIQSLGLKEINVGLERIKTIYKEIVKPDLNAKVVVVGGTNGKGTTVEILSRLLIDNNKTVGTFTSPHLFHYNERIKINGESVSDELIVESFKLINEARGSQNLTYFDFSTLAALIIFNKYNVDYMVLEIGLGGRLDPVNIVDSDIAILTNVELDHQEWLGEDRELIGKEKADIFKFRKTIILGQHNIPSSVIQKAKEMQTEIFQIGKEFVYQVDDKNKKWSFYFESCNGFSYQDITLNNFSVSSISCAITAYLLLEKDQNIDIDEVFNGLNLKGRCELIDKRYLLDVSHNESSAKYLASFIDRNFDRNLPITAVLGVMSDKDIYSILEPLVHRINKWYVTSPRIKRAMDAEKLSEAVISRSSKEVIITESVAKACFEANEDFDNNGLVLIFGSFYTVAEAFPALESLRSVA